MARKKYFHFSPHKSRRWACMDGCIPLTDLKLQKGAHAAYNRFVERWNRVELDHSTDLDNHEHYALDASFGLGFKPSDVHIHHPHFVLHMFMPRGFNAYHDGWSTGRNSIPFPTAFEFHYRDGFDTALRDWLLLEKLKFAADNRYDTLKDQGIF